MNTEPIVRLHLYFATDNDRAVILRQGPTRQTRMILWHRDTDQFEDGQWIKSKVYFERCGLSPDGRHFIFFALDGRWREAAMGAYSGLSRPPYWTALSVFPCGDTWGGGGFFIDNTHYLAYGDADIIGHDDGLSRVFQGEMTKDCRTGLRLVSGARAPLDRAVTKRLFADPPPRTERELFDRLTAPRESPIDRYDTLGGKLYRRKGLELELIRDFTDMTFEPIRAPYDHRPDPPEAASRAWHPLDGEAG